MATSTYTAISTTLTDTTRAPGGSAAGPEQTMRAIEGRRSNNQPTRRSPAGKQKLLRELRETSAGMGSHTLPALGQSVQKRIAELEAELGAAVTGRR